MDQMAPFLDDHDGSSKILQYTYMNILTQYILYIAICSFFNNLNQV